MTGLFRSHHPLTIVLLFFYGLALRTAAFMAPSLPVRTDADGYLFGVLADIMMNIGRSSPVFYPLMAYIFVFVQALMLNAQMDKDKLLPRTGFLPAMTYLLLTALLPEWWRLSSAMVSATLFIWIWGDMNSIFNARRPGGIIFMAGVRMGISALINFPSLLFSAFIFYAPAVMGTPRLRDWVTAVVGLLMPFYFFLSWMYLTSRWDLGRVFAGMRLQLPNVDLQPMTWVSIILLVVPFLWGVAALNRQLPRMLIRNRKVWTNLYGYLLLGLFIACWSEGQGMGTAFFALAPMAAFHAVVFEQPARPYLTGFLHLMTVSAIIGWNYLLLHK